MEDIELLRHYAENDSEEAFATLVRRHLNLVYSAALRRVGDDAHLAKDVTQKVFIALARQAAPLSRRQSLVGWLYTTARYSAAHVVRTERRRKERERKVYLMNEINSDLEPEPGWDTIRPALDRAMDRLSRSDREALLLRFFSGRPFSELGAALNLTEDAARKRVDRALERLRTQLGRRGASSTAGAVAIMLANHTVSAAPAGVAETVPAAALAAGAAKSGLGAAAALAAAAMLNLAVAGFAWHEFAAARRAQAAVAAAVQDYGARLQELRAVDAAALAADHAHAAPAPAGPKADARRFLASFPEARAMLIELGMSGALRTNGSFYRLAGFTPAEIDRFQKLVVESWADHLAAAGAPGTDRALSDAQVRALIGDQAFQKFQAFSQMIDAYRWTGTAATELNANGTPLSSAQADQLAQILADNNAAYRAGRALNRAAIDAGGAIASEDWDAAMAQAKTVLSPSQWAAAQPVFLNFQFEGALNRARSPE